MRRAQVRASHILCALGVTALSACNGGGSGTAVRPTPFTSWSNVQPNSTVVAEGIAQSGTVEYTLGGFLPTDTTVTSVGTVTAVENATATVSYDSSRTLTSLSISTPSASVSWSTGRGDTIDCTSAFGLCAAENRSATATGVAADPDDLGWNYQTFGVWTYETSSAVSPRTGNIGAISVGAKTPVSALPTTGTAVYNGLSAGFYVDSAGQPYLTGADVSATVDFGPARSVQFTTSNTNRANLNTGVSVGDANLNLSGTLSIATGTSQFTGTVTTGGAPLAGTATGSFYGPAYEEIGGIYNLKNPAPGSTEALIGGFGGNR